MKPVHHINVKKGMSVNALIREMEASGVMQSGKLAKAVGIAEKMITDKKCKVFMGISGAMVPGGMRQIIIDMLKFGWIDCLVTNGANLTHDLAEALGYHHYQGTDKVDDADLYKKGIDRIYDSYMPNKVYEGMEDFFHDNFDAIFQKNINIRQFLWNAGSCLKKESILKVCHDKKIPLFCPGIADCGIGLMVWGQLARGKDIKILAFDDLKEIIDLAWDKNSKFGVLYIGGGLPKNYIQQSMQFSPSKALYGVQITTDRPEHGGSSGAELREGISWGKLDAKAQFVDVACDATIALPIIFAALQERIK